MLEAGIQQLVVADAGVQAIIGTRFYPVLVPENPTYPCATYQTISNAPSYLLEGQPTLSSMRIQVDTWSGGTKDATYLAAKQAQEAISEVLDLFKGTLPDGTRVAGIFVVGSRDLYEQDARVYRTTTDYQIFVYPDAG